MLRSLLLVILTVPTLASAGTIYKCAGAGGATVFSQVPCGTDAAAVGSAGKKAPASPVADAAADKAALADIDARCDAQSHQIVDGYRTKFADANASIAALHQRLIIPGSGGKKDAAVQKQIDTLEGKKTDLLGAQDRELSNVREQCQAERSAEQKRQSDRDAAAHAVVKR